MYCRAFSPEMQKQLDKNRAERVLPKGSAALRGLRFFCKDQEPHSA